MNETVRKLVPVDALPEDLHEGFASGVTVEITGVAVSREHGLTELLARADALRAGRLSRFESSDGIVEYVRTILDCGDLTPWLGDPTSTRTP